MNNAKNQNSVLFYLLSETANRILKHKIAENPTKRKVSISTVFIVKKEYGVNASKTSLVAVKIYEQANANYIIILTTKVANLRKRSKKVAVRQTKIRTIVPEHIQKVRDQIEIIKTSSKKIAS